MARTIATIQAEIMTAIADDLILGAVLTSPSQVALYRLFAYQVATAIAEEEQIQDILQTNIENQ